jgi:hypothetical protein
MAAATNLGSLIEKEFQDVEKERQELMAKREEIEEQLRALDRRLQAAINCRATLEGKFPAPTRQRKPRETTGTRAPRGSRDQVKRRILDLMKQHPDGLVSDQINSALGTTDPKQRQRIANLLSLLKKDGELHQEARRGPYSLP